MLKSDAKSRFAGAGSFRQAQNKSLRQAQDKSLRQAQDKSLRQAQDKFESSFGGFRLRLNLLLGLQIRRAGLLKFKNDVISTI